MYPCQVLLLWAGPLGLLFFNSLSGAFWVAAKCAPSPFGLQKKLSHGFKGLVFLFSAVSQCFLCYSICPVLDSGKCLAFREEAITPPSVRGRLLFHPESINQITDLLFCCYPCIFKKGTGTTVSNYTSYKQPRGQLLPCNLVLNFPCQ